MDIDKEGCTTNKFIKAFKLVDFGMNWLQNKSYSPSLTH